MPAQRTHERSLGPLSDVDPDFRDANGHLLHKDTARSKNHQRLREVLGQLIPPPQMGIVAGRRSGHEGHRLGPLQMSVGTTGDHAIGCWYQICLWSGIDRCGRIIVLTPPIHDAAERFKDTDVPRLLAIREELKKSPRHSHLHASRPPIPSASLNSASQICSRLQHWTSTSRNSRVPPLDLTIQPPASPAHRHVTTVCWIKDGQGPIIVDLVPGEEGRLCFCEHKLALGAQGFEQGNKIEVYDTQCSLWNDILWRDMVPVHMDQPIFVKYKDVKDPSGLELYLE